MVKRGPMYSPKRVLPDIIKVLEKHNCPPLYIDDIARDLKEVVLLNPAAYNPHRNEQEEVKENEPDISGQCGAGR